MQRNAALFFLASLVVLAPRPAEAAVVLVVADGTADLEIATVLTADGHTVTTAMNDATASPSVLLGDLTGYDLVVWSGTIGFRNAATFTNLTSYVTGGGRVFYTGHNSTLSDPALWAFLGCTGAYDFPSGPGAISSADSPLTTGIRDIRGIVPSGGFSDRDAVTGLLAGTISISADTSTRGGHEWTLRTLGDGYVAWVSNGTFSGSHVSWSTTTGPIAAQAYNAAIRNFAFHAGGFSGDCTGGDDSACTDPIGRAGTCHGGRCCIGCWDGARCFVGASGAACGLDGGACTSCVDGMPCTLDSCSAGACSNPTAPTGWGCDDGEFCTVGETCDASSACTGGRANLCDDRAACTADVCHEDTDSCSHEPGGAGCLVGGTCYGAFTVNTSNRCQVCMPSVSTTAWSPRTVGTPCGTSTCSGAPGATTFNDGGRCDASGTCAPSTSMPCPQGVCASSSACSSTCTSSSCPAGLTCNSASMTCLPPAAAGSLCSRDADCASGSCADRICCDTACDQLCESCDLPGMVGTCMPTPVGGSCGTGICSGDSITNPGTCDAEGTCTRPAPERCPQGWCLDGVECAPNCLPDTCAPGEICTSEMFCVRPAEDGESCITGEGCVSGHCVDGVCCNRPCDEICESCVQAERVGRCVPYPAGIDPELDCPLDAVCSGGHGCMAAPDAGTPPIDAGLPDAGPVIAAERRGCACSAPGRSGGRGTVLVLALLALGLGAGTVFRRVGS